MNDNDFEFFDKELAFEVAERLTALDFEVTVPRSYDGGKTFVFTASVEV